MLKLPPLGICFVAAMMAGCSPQCNIGGAYFPAWLACMLSGTLGLWILHEIAVRVGFAAYLRPAPLVYLCAFASMASATWLLFFVR